MCRPLSTVIGVNLDHVASDEDEMTGLTPRRFVVLLAVGLSIALWIGIAVRLVATDFDLDVGGADYAMFHSAAGMVRDGTAADLYDTVAFQTAMTEVVGTKEVGGPAVYLLPPFIAAALVPLTMVGHDTGWLLWTVLALVALGAGLWLLSLRPLRATLVALVFPPVFFMIRLGQASFVAFLALSASFRALERRRIVLGGALAGLLAYKPQLALGLVVWWVIDRPFRKALIGLFAMGAVLLGASWIVAGNFVPSYLDAVRGALDRFSETGFLTWAYSATRFGTILFPGVPVAASLVTAALWILGGGGFVWFWRRHREEWRLNFAAAVVLGVWLTPHLLAYDWVVLLVPAAILWRERPAAKERWALLGALLALVAAFGGPITSQQLDWFGAGIQIATPGLALVAWLAARTVDAPSPAGDDAAAASGVDARVDHSGRPESRS